MNFIKKHKLLKSNKGLDKPMILLNLGRKSLHLQHK